MLIICIFASVFESRKLFQKMPLSNTCVQLNCRRKNKLLILQYFSSQTNQFCLPWSCVLLFMVFEITVKFIVLKKLCWHRLFSFKSSSVLPCVNSHIKPEFNCHCFP